MTDNKKYAIVDFSTTEVVRGSFGYDSYLLYSAMKHLGYNVDMYEDMTPFKLHRIDKKYNEYIIHFWSYPQAESIKWAKFNLRGKLSYIGYKPLIDKYNLEMCKFWNNTMLKIGMEYLPNIYKEMEYGLMSDCDLHIASNDKRPVFPLFISYGCPNQCEFCPIPPNRGMYKKFARVHLSNHNLYECLNLAFDNNRNIHFCDEDMFINRDWIMSVINHLIKLQEHYKQSGWKPFKWIGLASVGTFYNYVKEFGEAKLIKSGCHLIELGIEAKDANLRKEMNKTGNIDQVNYINKHTKNINKFWLTVTFFPGETIKTLNEMGEWLKTFGTKKAKLGNRLITNGNVGGLGQFFQLYDGANNYNKLLSSGMLLTDIPVRLIPSFVPDSFLKCKPIQKKQILKEDRCWFKTYNINIDKYKKIKFDGKRTVREIFESLNFDIMFLIYLALMCRLRYVRQ